MEDETTNKIKSNFSLDEQDDKPSLVDLLIENKDYIYPSLFYIAGLIIGSILYRYIEKTSFTQIMNTFATYTSSDYYAIFSNRFCIYFSLFTITVLLGLCLVGFPFINIMPLLIGVEISVKISYYYVNYSAKGISFAILMIIPGSVAFITLLIYTIKTSSQLSKSLYNNTIKKEDIQSEFNLKEYLKKFLIYAVIVVVITLFNTFSTYLLSTIVKI